MSFLPTKRRTLSLNLAEVPSPQNPYLKNQRKSVIRANGRFYAGGGSTPFRHSVMSQSNNDTLPSLRSGAYFVLKEEGGEAASAKQLQKFERLMKYESILESFLMNSLVSDFPRAIEETIAITLKASAVTLWQDIPSLHMLYSRKLSKVCSHNSGLVGYTFFSREIVKVENAAQHSAYNEQTDKQMCPDKTPVLLFPLWDCDNNVCGVVQVTRGPKNGFFNADDEDFVRFFTKRFKIYSSFICKTQMPHQLLSDLLQVMELEQFLLLFQQRILNFFQCKRTEIWFNDIRTKKLICYTKTIKEVDPSRSGIAGEALTRECPINCSSNKMLSSYQEDIDGTEEESVLVVPIFDVKKCQKWAIALRSKNTLPVFTSDDENVLRMITPYVAIALDNCQRFTEAGHGQGRRSLEHNVITSMQTVLKQLTEGAPINEIIRDSVSSIVSLIEADRCLLYTYNNATERYNTIIATNSNTPVITMPKDKGIVGKTFNEGEIFNIPDVNDFAEFDNSVDAQIGCKTKSLLSVPVYNNRKEVIAVIQFMNRKDMKPFSNIDIGFVQIFSIIIGLIIENNRMFLDSTRADAEVRSFINVATTMASNSTVKNILSEILSSARKTIQAERASLFILDEIVGVLSTFIADGGNMPLTVPLSHGIAATAVNTRTAVRVDDAYHDPRFNKMIDFHTGFKTTSVIAVPVISADGRILGVVEMINRKEGVFNDNDQSLLTSFVVFAACVLETHRLQDIVEKGKSQIEMSKWIGELERTSYKTPVKLQIPKHKVPEVTTLNFFSIDWNGIGLFKVAFFTFDSFGLLETFNITNELFFTFLYKLRECYYEPPYHNWIHAIDVLQYISYQVRLTHSDQILTKFELLAVCIAALCHDAGHQGFNNAYNVNAETPLGILFKDLSVMETYHCTVAIRILQQPECNLLHSLNDDEQRIIWKWIIHLILATDMAFHFKLIKQGNEILEQGALNLKEESHRLMAMELIMKVSDISNVSRPFVYADRWCEVLSEEFWRQGDKEKELGMPYSSDLTNREGQNKAKGQVGFYTFVCLPLYTLIARLFPELQVNLDSMKSNLERWKQIDAEQEAAKAALKNAAKEAEAQGEEEKEEEKSDEANGNDDDNDDDVFDDDD